MHIDVVVLAGGDASKVNPAFSGPKSLIDIGGRPMISYVMDALSDCPALGEIVLALPEGAEKGPFEAFGGLIVEGTTGVVDGIAKSINLVGENGYVLIVSSDTPMIRSLAINDFLDNCQQEEAQVYYSIISKEDIQDAFPDTRRTYMRLKDGVFTGGNIHLADKATFLRNMTEGNQLFNLRKNPLSLIGLFGIGFVLKYITGRLDIETLENKAQELLHADVKAVVTRYPELGVDVDKPEDLRLVETHILAR